MRSIIKDMNRGDELTIRTISDLSADPEETLKLLEEIVDKGIVLEILDMGIIDDSPAGKQLLCTIGGMLG